MGAIYGDSATASIRSALDGLDPGCGAEEALEAAARACGAGAGSSPAEALEAIIDAVSEEAYSDGLTAGYDE